LVAIAIVLFEGAVYWLISGFFFAGVASNVIRESENSQPLVHDAFSDARQRLGAIATIALLTWAAFAAGRILLGLVLTTQRLGLLRRPMLFSVVFGVALLLLCVLLSRLGMAIPISMDNPGISARHALRLSLVKTENWEPFFMMFLVKSAVVGYAVYWIVNLGLDNLLDRGWLDAEAFPWLQAAFYICVAAILESPLFIAFSLLYIDSKVIPEEAVPAAVG
jgi:hypothetical protein